LKDYSYIANNACVGASVILEEGAYLGTNCSTIENISIGKWAVVGIGTVVIRSVGDYEKVVGNPARVIGTVK
jgi:acetyltransferase EpsM